MDVTAIVTYDRPYPSQDLIDVVLRPTPMSDKELLFTLLDRLRDRNRNVDVDNIFRMDVTIHGKYIPPWYKKRNGKYFLALQDKPLIDEFLRTCRN